MLSPEQRLAYEEDGFILIKNLVSEEDIDRFRQDCHSISTLHKITHSTLESATDFLIKVRKTKVPLKTTGTGYGI